MERSSGAGDNCDQTGQLRTVDIIIAVHLGAYLKQSATLGKPQCSGG